MRASRLGLALLAALFAAGHPGVKLAAQAFTAVPAEASDFTAANSIGYSSSSGAGAREALADRSFPTGVMDTPQPEAPQTEAPQPMAMFIAEASPAAFLPAAELDLASSSDPGAAPAADPGNGVTLPPVTAPMPLAQCPYERTNDKRCHMHWHQMIIEASLYLTFQNVGNAYTGYWYRWETTNGKWWDRYVNSVEQWRWNKWQDQNPFLDDYIGHSMMGGITNAIWEQNDPLGMTVVQANNWIYWRSRLRATAFSTFFSYEWKLGPIGEAGMHNGDHFFFENGQWTNETGWVELITTPLGGLTWNIAEDYLDRTLIPRLQNFNRSPLMLFAYSLMTPSKAMANVLRFRPPWYRDSRVVKAKSFWSDPPSDRMVGLNATPSKNSAAANGTTASTVDTASLTAAWNHAEDASSTPAPASGVSSSDVYVASASPAPAVSAPKVDASPMIRVMPAPVSNTAVALKWGGVHEFGVIWGFSAMTGHVLGNVGDVKYMPIAVRYSYLLHQNSAVALRYSPEFTALSMIDWPTPQPAAIQRVDLNSIYDQRTRAYGAGASPVGLQVDFAPRRRLQPFLGTNEGAIYYDQPVLGNPPVIPGQPVTVPVGPRLLYVADIGAGINIFHHRQQEITIGYRYQHLTGTNAASARQSTDANVFYVGVSRFRTRHSDDVH